ncbi:MAG: hypothetical protein IAF02_23205 [Anaerolineae bacterium]|nr:hypothetical protein [Anaerolineae bacterium]
MVYKNHKHRIYEGQFVAEVKVELITTDDEWSPYLSLEDAYKLDDVREALRQEDFQTATKLATVFRLTPIIT